MWKEGAWFSLLDRTLHEFTHYAEEQPALRPVITRTHCPHLQPPIGAPISYTIRGQLKCANTRAETRFRLSAKRTSPFKSAGASVHSSAGSRGVRISSSNAGYIMFRGSVKGTGYPLHSPVSPSLPLPWVTVCHHVSTGVHNITNSTKTVTYLCHKHDALCTTDVHHHCQPAVPSLQRQGRRERLSRQDCRQPDSVTC